MLAGTASVHVRRRWAKSPKLKLDLLFTRGWQDGANSPSGRTGEGYPQRSHFLNARPERLLAIRVRLQNCNPLRTEKGVDCGTNCVCCVRLTALSFSIKCGCVGRGFSMLRGSSSDRLLCVLCSAARSYSFSAD